MGPIHNASHKDVFSYETIIAYTKDPIISAKNAPWGTHLTPISLSGLPGINYAPKSRVPRLSAT